jgi:4-amino-4-deoxy-L-arabinose transferase-like glycosyltransferase
MITTIGQAPPLTDDQVSDHDRGAAPAGHHHISLGDWLWLGVAVLLSLAVRIPFFRIPLLADEGGYAYAASGWVEGTGQLYDDLWISRPQGIFFIYAGILDLFGGDSVAFRFAAWIAIAVTTVAVWGFARMWTSPLTSTVSAFVFVLLSASPSFEGYSANSEMFMGCPLALAMLWLLGASRAGWESWQLVGIGILIGLATSIKPAAVVMIPATLAFIWLLADGSSARERLRRSLMVAMGTMAVGMISLIHGWYLGWSDFIYATVFYRISAQSTVAVGLEHNLWAIVRLMGRSWALLALVAWVLLWRHADALRKSLGADLLASATRHWRSGLRTSRMAAHADPSLSRPWIWPFIRQDSGQPSSHGGLAAVPRLGRPTLWRFQSANDSRLLLRLWIVASLIGISMGGDWWAHYMIQLVAPLSVWLAVSAMAILPRLSHAGRRTFITISVGLLVAPFWVLVLGTPERMTDAMYSQPGYPAQEVVATYLREHTDPDDRIYVAFDQAAVYYLADRLPAYRHLYDQELRGIPNSYAEIISIIRSDDRPKYIVATREPGPFPDDSRAFWLEVGQYYELETTIDGVPIYRDRASIPAG